MQYLIAYTSDRDSLVGGEWSTNGAGLKVSHKFGFGAVDAEAMVTRARRWINVPEQQSSTVYGTFGLGYVLICVASVVWLSQFNHHVAMKAL